MDTLDATANSQLRGFLTRALGADIGDHDDYFALGMVNSLFALELVTFVEHRFGFQVEVDDLDLDNFRTLSRLTAFVRART